MEVDVLYSEQTGSELTPRIRLGGVLDHQSIRRNFSDSEAYATLIAQKPATVTVVFDSDVKIDTAGLAWIINAVRDVKQQSIKIQFDDIPSALQELAILSGAQSIISTQ